MVPLGFILVLEIFFLSSTLPITSSFTPLSVVYFGWRESGLCVGDGTWHASVHLLVMCPCLLATKQEWMCHHPPFCSNQVMVFGLPFYAQRSGGVPFHLPSPTALSPLPKYVCFPFEVFCIIKHISQVVSTKLSF